MQHLSLFSVFQPIVSLVDSSLLGHEALIRGRDANGSVLGAPAVLEAAESAGDGPYEFDQKARIVHLENAVRQALPGTLFLNLIPGLFPKTEQDIEQLLRAIDRLGYRADRVVLEVTCSQHLAFEQLQAVLDAYGRAGFCFALDDLGTWAMPASLLENLEPAYIKLDRSLIDQIDRQPVQQQQARQWTEQAHSRAIAVIAEGIEREEEAACCRNLGIEYGQGYLLGRPSEYPQRQGVG